MFQLLLQFGQLYPTLPDAEQKKIANVLIESIEIFPTKRAYGYLKTIHFSFPVLSGNEIKQTMTIWDSYPDILDEDGNFNGYNPEDDLPPMQIADGTIVVYDEDEVFPPKKITDESIVCLSKLADTHIELEIDPEELDTITAKVSPTYPEIKAYVLEHHGMKVSSLAIAQAKKKCGLEVGECYNLPSGHGRPPTNLTPEKEAAIRDAFQYYGLI